MPTYTYRCENHGEFDRYASMKAIPKEVACPACGCPSPKIFAPIVNCFAPTAPLDSRSIRNRWQQAWSPQYGHCKNTYEMAGKEKAKRDDMNRKQGGGDRWQTERSVLDGV